MPSILNEISFFQFDNLVRNRIPFVLLNIGVDLGGFYSQSVYQTHLQSLLVLVCPQNAFEALQKLNRPAHEAVVVLCADGSQSSQVVDILETEGFNNVFYVKGGLHALKRDASR